MKNAHPKVAPRVMSEKLLLKHVDAFGRSLSGKRPETRGTYQRALREFTRWFRKDRSFRFREVDVHRYKRHLKKRRLSDVSIATYLTSLRRFCQFLVDTRVLGSNPAKRVEGSSRPEAHSRDVLSQEEVTRLLGSVQQDDERGLRDYAVIRLMLHCGLSEIEIVRADVGDLTSADGSHVLRVQGKGRVAKDQVVAIPPGVQESLVRYLAVRRGEMGADTPLFASAGNRTRGLRMTTRGIRDRVNFHLERAGVKGEAPRKVSPYSLRHTAALMMADGGATAEEIRRRMRLGSDATAMLYINHKNRQQQP